MAVKIRLKRMGKIRAPYYRVVVADSRTKRDGRSIEEIGKYHPTEEPSLIEIDSARAQYWLSVGAQPSPQVEALLKLTGDWGIFKGDKGAKSTVKLKEPKVEFQADEKKKPVLKPKSEKPAPVEDKPAPAAEAPAEEAAASEVAASDQADAPEAVVSDGAAEEAPAPEAVDEAPALGDAVEAPADEAAASDEAASDDAASDDADKA